MEGPYPALRGILRDLGPCLVAFSGGVDSTFLLKVAHDVLGDGVTAVTAVSPSLAATERQDAEDLARLVGARHLLVPTGELDDPRYVRNDGARCYYCKSELFRVLRALLASAGGGTIIYGAITDDLEESGRTHGQDELPPLGRQGGPEQAVVIELDARVPALQADPDLTVSQRLHRSLGALDPQQVVPRHRHQAGDARGEAGHGRLVPGRQPQPL